MSKALQVPAMRGVIGDWVYYVTLLPFQEVSSRIRETNEIHKSQLLKDMIQRVLTPRSKTIAEYIKSQTQHFFNAIVVGVYEGEPKWHQLDVGKSDLFDPSNLEPRVANSLGILTLSGEEKLFAIDGQHRVEGIKEFVRELKTENLKELEDEICAIFVAHSNEPSGLQRTRRLFATINRYAKPVSLTEIIALDEDDVVAITCRDLLENHSLFKNGRVSLKKGKAISPHDDTNVTSLAALYQAMDSYLMNCNLSKWKAYKAVRPASESEVQDFIQKGHKIWDLLIDSIAELKRVRDLPPSASLPAGYRSTKGGDLLFRAIAIPMIARCLRRAETFGMKEKVFIKRFAKIPRVLHKTPWRGVLWDGSNMMISEKNIKLADGLILWMVNCDPTESKIKSAILKKQLGNILIKPADTCSLPPKVD
ncbi:MAG: DGQHR domain-containing protein [Nitrospira sp.]|nr:DGQHR domain-containing protein [Nitrospira sp.]